MGPELRPLSRAPGFLALGPSVLACHGRGPPPSSALEPSFLVSQLSPGAERSHTDTAASPAKPGGHRPAPSLSQVWAIPEIPRLRAGLGALRGVAIWGRASQRM